MLTGFGLIFRGYAVEVDHAAKTLNVMTFCLEFEHALPPVGIIP